MAVGITAVFLPFRWLELMPLEEVWRGLTQTVTANRGYASLEELITCALAWLTTMTNAQRRRRCGLQSSKFECLPTTFAKDAKQPGRSAQAALHR